MSVSRVVLNGFKTGAETARNAGRIVREQKMYRAVMSNVTINPNKKALPKALNVKLVDTPAEVSPKKVLAATSEPVTLDRNPRKIRCNEQDGSSGEQENKTLWEKIKDAFNGKNVDPDSYESNGEPLGWGSGGCAGAG